MSDREEPEFYAWVDEANAGDAYMATLATLYDPAVQTDGAIHGVPSTAIAQSLDMMLSDAREAFWGGHIVRERIYMLMRSQNWFIDVVIRRRFPSDHGGGSPGCLLSVDYQYCEAMPQYTKIAVSQGDLSVPVQAAILGLFGQENMEKVFLGMCAPDGHSRVRRGAYPMLVKLFEWYVWDNTGWRAPLEMAATYHGDHLVARDVALSWLYLHDGGLLAPYLDLSLEALMARVEAAPVGATIGISSRPEDVVKHGFDERKDAPDYNDRTPVNACRGPRPRFPEDDILTREQVLATLQTPSETLIQALEAAAAPDAEWLEAEKLALDVLAAKKPDEPAEFVKIDQLDQRNFLELHAPYHVRRLPNGGVMLATHPYRYLWPLWARALHLLGIRPQTA